MADEEGEGAAERGPKSAFHFFRAENLGRIRARLAAEDEAVGAGDGGSRLGALTQALGQEWRDLRPEERVRYEAAAQAARERFEATERTRDAEVFAAQEAKRASWASTSVAGERVRAPKGGGGEGSAKRAREVSAEAKERQQERKRVRQEERKSLQLAEDRQFEDIRTAKAQQAEARLQFLLAQSDIFSHFGIGKELAAKAEENGPGPSRRMTEEEEDARMMQAGQGGDGAASGEFLLAQPTCITGQLRAYQLEGLNWMIRLHQNGINGILADEMGLGKTLQSISVLGYMMEYRKIRGPHIVLVPKSTLSNWINEFRRWCPTLRVVRFHGPKEERETFVREVLKPQAPELRDWDVVVTTYEISNIEKRVLCKFPWRYMIIDEAHRLKNEASQFSTTVREMETQHRLLLTGTPLQNNLHELWALLNFLLPDVFASSDEFDDWFNLDIDDDNAKQRIISQLHKLLRPFMLRRLKSDVEKSLPPKSETILFVGMSAMQKQLYKKLLKRDISTLQGAAGTSRSAVLNIVMQLRKCCNHPYLFQGVEDRSLDPLGAHLWSNCGKMVLLDKLLTKMHSRGHRVLLFTQMTRMMDIMEDYCVAKGYLYCRIDGNTSYELRESQIEDYNAPGSDKFLFLLSTRAGGLGLNLQTADTCILYDSDWNPQADLQAQDRCHRIGQTKLVNVFRLVTEHTVEEKIIERAQKKLKLDAMVVQQGRLQDKERKLGKEELLDSIRYGADQVFRSSESSSISDDDIDAILEQGRKRTEAMEAALADLRGDALDFKLDGGLSTQTFEGVDYTKQEHRKGGDLNFIEIGKRERKRVDYSGSLQYPAGEPGATRRNVSAALQKKYSRLPKHLRLPRMEEWHFYDRQRLEALSEKEERQFVAHCKTSKPTSAALKNIQVLMPNEVAEKEALLAEGFGDWTRSQFVAFHKASAKHGRDAVAEIARDCGRSEAEVTAYAKAFWKRGPVSLAPAEWDRIVKNIEKGERKLEEIARLTACTRRFLSGFADPWTDLSFRHVGNWATGGDGEGRGGSFQEEEDRYLLCLADRHGYGNWEDVRLAIRGLEHFRFDYFLQSCSAEVLGRRCESLMRLVEKELAEREKRRGVHTDARKKVEASLRAAATSTVAVAVAAQEVGEEQAVVANRQANLRREIDGRVALLQREAAQRKAAGLQSVRIRPAEVPEGDSDTGDGASRPAPRSVPEDLMPELVELVAKGGTTGIERLVATFHERHNEVSKRQIGMRINEVAHKSRLTHGGPKVWCIRTGSELYLPPGAEAIVRDPEGDIIAGAPRPRPLPPPPAKRRGSEGHAEGTGSPPLRKRPKTVVGGNSGPREPREPAAAPRDAGSREPPEPPKKAGSALKFFATEMKKQIKKSYPKADKQEKVQRLKELWAGLDATEREVYEKMQASDSRRYDREYEEYLRRMKAFSGKGPKRAVL